MQIDIKNIILVNYYIYIYIEGRKMQLSSFQGGNDSEIL